VSLELADLPRSVLRYGVGIWRRRWAAVAVAWTSALLLWAAIWLLPDKYESAAQVFVQTESILDPVMTGVTARPNYERRVEVMRLQLLTRPNVEEIIYRSGLDKEVKGGSDAERRASMERLIDWVAGDITINSPQEMYFVITYKNSDPAISKSVVDATLNLLIEQDLGASLTEREEANRRLEAEIAAFDTRLTAKEREVADYRRTHAEELAVVDGNARDRELLTADLSRVEDEIAMTQRRVTSLRGELSATRSAASSTELDNLKVELAALRSQYNEDYPDIAAVKARIAQLEVSGAGEASSSSEYRRATAELRAAQDSVAGLEDRRIRIRGQLEELAFTMGQAPKVLADLQRIERDYEQTRKSYEELLERRDRLSLTASLGAGSQGVEYKIYERPRVSLVPVAPPRLLMIIGATIAALGAGVAAAIGMTWMRRTFTHPDSLNEVFGLPVLGALSEVSSTVVKEERKTDLRRLAVSLAGLFALAGAYAWWDVFRVPTVAEGAAPAIKGEQGVKPDASKG
jgi:polysaccharide chain length determinant protein (PEP-CTERM system associated)